MKKSTHNTNSKLVDQQEKFDNQYEYSARIFAFALIAFIIILIFALVQNIITHNVPTRVL